MSAPSDNMVTLDALSESDRRRGQATLIRVAMTGSVMYTCVIGTTISTQYILSVDSDPKYVGMLQTLMSLAPLGTLVGVHLVSRLGKVGLTLWGRWLSVPLVVAMLVLAGIGVQGTAGVTLTILFIAGLSFTYNLANTSWWPLMQDNIGPDPAGNYLARLRTRLRGVEIGLPLLVGLYLGHHPPLQKFLLPFALALGALIVGTLWMRNLPQRAVSAPAVGLALRLRLAGRSAAVRRYLVFLLAFTISLNMFWSFAMVLLTAKDKNPFPALSEGFVLSMIAVSAVGHMASLRFWGRLVDNHGSRSANTLSLLGTALLGLAWLALPTEQYWLMAWTISFYLVWGFFEGGSLMGRTFAMLRAVPDIYQADGFVLMTIVGAIGLAIGAFVGGQLFGYLTDFVSRAGLPPFWDARKLYLAVVQMGFLVAWLLSRRFVGHAQQTSTRDLVNEWVRKTMP